MEMQTSNIVITEFTSSAIVVFLMQRLKQAKWFPLLQAGKANVNRIFAVGAAALGAIGVNFVWDSSSHSLTITGLTLWGVAIMFWKWLNHYAIQETIYQATSNKSNSDVDGNGTGNGSKVPQYTMKATSN